MSEQVELGLSGLSVPPGTHLCAFFRGREERNAIVHPFLREGVSSGAKCIGILEGPSEAALAQELGIVAAPPQLELRTARPTYLPGGRFSRADSLAYWETEAAESLGSGAWPFARFTGEMTAEVNLAIPSEEWIRYESDLNRFVPRYPQVLLCLYDLLDFSGSELFVDIVKTHPMVLIGGTILENRYFLDPDDFDHAEA
ncbi:MAG: eukaryotic-like serine/threonine-protein kinase [Kribbellaceae bacterium]|nr:eukaryotic-like serine/threonine-protein kinase [Kribbellaceae bacterium]